MHNCILQHSIRILAEYHTQALRKDRNPTILQILTATLSKLIYRDISSLSRTKNKIHNILICGVINQRWIPHLIRIEPLLNFKSPKIRCNWNKNKITKKYGKSEESDLHNLAEQADRVRHVRSKRGTEDDLRDTCFGQILALLADNIRSKSLSL